VIFLGRAFVLSHLPSPGNPTLSIGSEIQELWAVMQDIFITGLFTSDPEIGAWYAAGILVLACSETLKTRDVVDGKGKDWCKTVLGGLIIMDVELIDCYESNLSLYITK
jgi:hypothetical protein